MIVDLPFNEANRKFFETKIDFEKEEKLLEEEEKRLKEKKMW